MVVFLPNGVPSAVCFPHSFSGRVLPKVFPPGVAPLGENSVFSKNLSAGKPCFGGKRHLVWADPFFLLLGEKTPGGVLQKIALCRLRGLKVGDNPPVCLHMYNLRPHYYINNIANPGLRRVFIPFEISPLY